MIKESLMTLLTIIICGAISIVTVYVANYMQKLSQKAKEEANKIKNANERNLIDTIIDRLDNIIEANVVKANLTLTNDLKLSQDNEKVDEEKLKDAIENIKSDILDQISDKNKNIISNDIKDLDKYVKAKIQMSSAKLR